MADRPGQRLKAKQRCIRRLFYWLVHSTILLIISFFEEIFWPFADEILQDMKRFIQFDSEATLNSFIDCKAEEHDDVADA